MCVRWTVATGTFDVNAAACVDRAERLWKARRPGGATRSNPLVSVAALGVLRTAALSRIGVDPAGAPQP
jgi:hypothetical protein